MYVTVFFCQRGQRDVTDKQAFFYRVPVNANLQFPQLKHYYSGLHDHCFQRETFCLKKSNYGTVPKRGTFTTLSMEALRFVSD